MTKQVLILILVLSSAVTSSAELGLVLSKRNIPSVVQRLLKSFEGPSGSIEVQLETLDIYPSFDISEVTDSSAIEILNEISSLKSYDHMDAHLALKEPLLKIDLSDVMDLSITSKRPGEYNVKGFILLNKIAFETEKLSFCDDKNSECLAGNLIISRDLGLEIKSTKAKAEFEFLLQDKTDGVYFSLVQFKTNFAELASSEISLNILGELKIPEITIEINGHKQEIDTSHFKKALLRHDKWIAKKIIHMTSEYLVETFAADITDLLNDMPVNKEFSFDMPKVDYLKPKKKRDDYYSLLIQKRKDRIPSPLIKNKKQSKDFALFFQTVIQKAKVKYEIDRFISNSEVLGVSFNTDIELNSQKINYAKRSTQVHHDDLLKSENFSLIATQDFLNELVLLSKKTKIFDHFFNFVQDEKGTNVKNFKLAFQSKKLVLTAQIEIDLNEKSFIGSLIEMNNNNGVIEVPITLDLLPYFHKNGSISLINFKVDSPFLKDTNDLKDYLSQKSESFKEANFLIKNKIIKGVKELLSAVAKTSIPTIYDFSSNITLNIENLKLKDGKAKVGFYFLKKSEFN